MQWWAGNRRDAEQAGREAVEVLEQAGDARLLALALSNQSQLCMLAHRSPPRAFPTASAPPRSPARRAIRR